jgi:hypothetical protein
MSALAQSFPSSARIAAALLTDLLGQSVDVPPMTPPAPIDEPEPDRLPDEAPLPNPDESDNPPKSVWAAGGRLRSLRPAVVFALPLLRSPRRTSRCGTSHGVES